MRLVGGTAAPSIDSPRMLWSLSRRLAQRLQVIPRDVGLAKILMTAAPYGFGPTAKLLCLAQALSGRHELTYVGGNPGLQLAATAGFDRVLDFGSRDAWSAEAAAALRSADLLITVHEARPLYLGFGIPERTLFLDTLLWARPIPVPECCLPTVYVSQRFFRPPLTGRGLTDRVRLVGAIVPRNSTVSTPTGYQRPRVGPVRGNRTRVLVNLGGLKSPLMLPGADVLYARAVVRLVAKTRLADGTLDFCLPSYLTAYFGELQSMCPNARFSSPDYRDFQDLLSRASLLLTTPGLESVLEGLAHNVPMAFLPAHNGTQFLQDSAYRENSLGLIHLEDNLPALPESDLGPLTHYVQVRNGCQLQDERMLSTLAAALDWRIAYLDDENAYQSVQQGRKLLASIGLNGLSELEAVVEDLLR